MPHMPGTGVNPLRQAEGAMLIMPEKEQPVQESPPPPEVEESPLKPESPQITESVEIAAKEPTVTIERKPEENKKKKKKSGLSSLCCCIKPKTDETDEGEGDTKGEVKDQNNGKNNVNVDVKEDADKVSGDNKAKDAPPKLDNNVTVKPVEEANVSVQETRVKPVEKQQADVEIMI